MSHRLYSLSALALSACLALPAFAQDTPSADSVVASVNGTDITLGHMMIVRQTLPEQYRQLPGEVLFKGILDQLIQQTVLEQSGTGEETLRVKLALDNERRAMMAAEAVEDIAAKAVTDEAVQAAYDARFDGADLGNEYNAAHILVETEEEAEALIAELEGGADFAALAKEKSTGPSGPSGGDLGWFGPGMMVPEFETAVMEMEKGTISEPIQTQFGWHVVRLNDVRARNAPPLDEVRGEIEQQLQKQAVEARVKELVDAADVTRISEGEIDPALLQQTDLLED